MSRRHRAERRPLLPDPRYGSPMLTRFMNALMVCGKKSIAERILYGALAQIEAHKGEEPLPLFQEALENVMPTLEVRARRVGGATYQVPMEVREERRQALAIRWLITAARKRGEGLGGKTMRARLAAEFLDAAANRGAAVKKREEIHRMAEANRAFAHYRW